MVKRSSHQRKTRQGKRIDATGRIAVAMGHHTTAHLLSSGLYRRPRSHTGSADLSWDSLINLLRSPLSTLRCSLHLRTVALLKPIVSLLATVTNGYPCRKALAGLTVAGLTAGGESHPAPKTYCCADHMTGGNTLAQMKKDGRAQPSTLFRHLAREAPVSLSYF